MARSISNILSGIKRSSFLTRGSIVKYYFQTPGGNLLHNLKIKGVKDQVFIRRDSTTDRGVLKGVFYDQYHIPSEEMQIPERCAILDLGSNIGLTVVHFKNLYPNATIHGYEMNYDNYLVAKKNCECYNDVHLHNEAVWIKQGSISYYTEVESDAFSIEGSNESPQQKMAEVPSVSIGEIIRKNELDQIDYLKMDIEGAEANIFKEEDLSWMRHVRNMNIEIHDDETMELQDFINILNSNGFRAWRDLKHWSSIMAVSL